MWGKREVYCIGKYKKKSTTNQDKIWTISAYIHSSNAFALVTAMATKLQTCTHTQIYTRPLLVWLYCTRPIKSKEQFQYTEVVYR